MSESIVLVGDSIFDNATYVPGEPCVTEQLRARVREGVDVSMLAVDGDFANDVGVILDLRDGYGGAWWEYLDAFFPDRGDYFVAHTFNADGAAEPVAAEAQVNNEAYSGPMAVLINAGTRSGKEALAYQFVKTGRATVIGTTTAGAFSGGMGIFAQRDAGYVLYLAVLEMRLDDRVIEGVGVAPHIEVSPQPGVDAPLRRALEELGCERA